MKLSGLVIQIREIATMATPDDIRPARIATAVGWETTTHRISSTEPNRPYGPALSPQAGPHAPRFGRDGARDAQLVHWVLGLQGRGGSGVGGYINPAWLGKDRSVWQGGKAVCQAWATPAGLSMPVHGFFNGPGASRDVHTEGCVSLSVLFHSWLLVDKR